ncbi:MAG: hypothetical protein K0R98_1920 [Rickettsiaceae bacterium]|nr:hypothetical protein [Rickettsiaceae bacterium]
MKGKDALSVVQVKAVEDESEIKNYVYEEEFVVEDR